MALAVDVLKHGGLVAFPTETVYGLGARALDGACVARIFTAKGRPGWNPLIAHVTDAEMARRDVVAEWSPTAETLSKALWPGPLTLVLPRAGRVPDELCAGLPSVAVRAPAHPVAHGLIALLGEPVAAPSANRFTGISPTTADHVEKSLGDAVDMILDGGPTLVGVESTVVDLTGPAPCVMRPGGVMMEQLKALLPECAWCCGAPVHDGAARVSPGMVTRHYAPRAVVRLVPFQDEAAWIAAERALPRPLGALSFTLEAREATLNCRLPLEPAAAQTALYASLHQLEDVGCAGILVEAPPALPEWEAVKDRLARAAG